MRHNISVLNLSGIYENEAFHRNVEGLNFVDLKGIPGTNCMCDDAAKELLIKAIIGDSPENLAARGLHFIDNGNYHYISALYLSLVKDPFSLVVLDHHPDMQAPMFDILSCGGWILHVIENNEYVRDIHVIGADPNLISQLDEKTRERVKFYNPEDVFTEDESEGSLGKILLPKTDYPVFLSVDKDVMSKEELITNWDQGELTGEGVIDFIKTLCERETGALGHGLIGIDICGECAPEQEDTDIEAAIAGNDSFNEEILHYYMHNIT